MDEPGVTLNVPDEADCAGPIPVQVTMRADMRTYWDTDGIVDKALTLALVRRDAPGLRFLAKVDPDALLLPDEPLPDRPTDEQLEADPSMIVEERTFDVTAFGAQHEGAAEHYVVAGFSRFWTAPLPLRITDRQNRTMPPQTAQVMQPARGVSIATGVQIMPHQTDDGLSLDITFAGQALTPAWVTVLGFRKASDGGACGGLFAPPIPPTADSGRAIGGALVPVSALRGDLRPGTWTFFAFFGDEISAPLELELTEADVAN